MGEFGKGEIAYQYPEFCQLLVAVVLKFVADSNFPFIYLRTLMVLIWTPGKLLLIDGDWQYCR